MKQRQTSTAGSLLVVDEANMIDALSSTELDVEQLEQLVDEENEDHQAEQESKAAADTRVFGRDKNGQYKNHANFVKLRNKINS